MKFITAGEIIDSFIPEELCTHKAIICFELKSGRKILECPACGIKEEV